MARTSNQASYRSRTNSLSNFGSRTDVGNIREQNEDSLIVKPPL